MRAPVIPGAPALRQALHHGERHAVAGAGPGHLIRPAGRGQPRGEVVEVALRDVDAERRDRCDVVMLPRYGLFRPASVLKLWLTLTHVGTSAQLLSLLARRGWSGDGLAARLEVTERSVWCALWNRAAGRTTGTVRGRLGTWQLSFQRGYACRGS